MTSSSVGGAGIAASDVSTGAPELSREPLDFTPFVLCEPVAHPLKSKTATNHAITMYKLFFMDAKDTRLLLLNQSRFNNFVHSNLIKGVFTRRISARSATFSTETHSVHH
jgi:hypothetical protein